MSGIDELIERLCPDGVEYKSLENVGRVSRGKRVTRKDLLQNGEFPVFQNSLIPLGYYSECNYPKGTVFVICAGAAGQIGYSSSDFWAADDCSCIVCSDNLLPRFLYHFLKNNQRHLLSKVRKASIPRLSKGVIEQLRIPVPPIEIQEEIVRILDSFSELEAKLEAKLEAELEARKTQHTFYRSRLLSFSKGESSISWRRLGEIGKLCMCKRIFKSQTSKSGDVPFYKIGTFGGNPDAFISRELYQEYRMKYSYPKKGDLLISCSGTIGKTVVFDGSDSYYQDSNIVWIDNDESLVTNPFLRHIYSVIKWPISKGGTIGRLYGKDIERIPIPIPPLEEQHRIVSILDKFDALVNDLSSGIPAEIEARRKQYEYYRDKLLTFKEKPGD